MNYDIRRQRRIDWAVWVAALTYGLFALHEVHGATSPATAGPATSVPVIGTASAAVATTPTPEALHLRECGDCHLAFAPRLLPASTWRQIMTGLDRHFGVDASLDAATATTISDWLAQGAVAPGRPPRAGREEDDDEMEGERQAPRAAASRVAVTASPAPAAPPPAKSTGRAPPGARADDGAALRITTTPWFVREHREVPAATWRRAAIGSAAHCAACHTDAERGRFSERALRIPN